jgi:putative transcriptional regulator
MSKQAFDSIMTGLHEALEYAKGDKTKGRSRIREAPPKIRPIKEYSKDSIKDLRIGRGLSQRAFAEVLGVSKKTVEAWEKGINHPAGSSSRMIELMEKDNQLLEHYEIVIRP